MASRHGLVRDLTIGAAGLAALGVAGVADATIGDDADFTAIYLALIAGVAWTSRLVVANVIAVAALVASLAADVVAHPPDLDFVLPFTIDGKSVALHPSIGCAIAPTDGDDSTALLRVADERMYRDKSHGIRTRSKRGIEAGAPVPRRLKPTSGTPRLDGVPVL